MFLEIPLLTVCLMMLALQSVFIIWACIEIASLCADLTNHPRVRKRPTPFRLEVPRGYFRKKAKTKNH